MRVEYNGVVIDHAHTTSWDETQRYDPSGMNLIGSEITLTFEGCVFGDMYGAGFANGRPDVDVEISATPYQSSLGSRLNIVLRQLSTPRKRLLVYDALNSELIFQAYPQDGNDGALTETQKRNIDVNGGPKPSGVRVMQVANDWARIAFTIKVVKIRCLGGEINVAGATLGPDPTQDFVVSNRCHTDESIDDKFYLTRTFAGRLTISAANDSVLYYRELFYPPLEIGFRRTAVRFSESEDGLSLSYSVVDKQVRCAAPYPATSFNGSVSYSIINGAKMGFEINLSLIGRPDCDKRALVSLALQGVTRKIYEFSKAGNGFYESFRVSENLDDPPQVSVSIKATLYTKTKGSKDEQDSFPSVAQAFVPGIEVIGNPVEFEGISDGVQNFAYDRFRSANPSPWGYNVFCAYDDDEDKNKREAERFKGFEYIKCLATVPCVLPTEGIVISESPSENARNSAYSESLATKVTQDPDGVDYRVKESGATSETVEYRYSHYKSDIQYSTGMGTLVVPNAEPSHSSQRTTTARTTAVAELAAYDAQIDNIRAQIDEIERSLLGSENGSVTLTDPGAGEEEPGEETEQTPEQTRLAELYASLRGLLQNRSKYALEVNCSSILRIARPQPRATVVIEAERFGRMPEMPDPEEIVSTEGEDPIVFTPISHSAKIVEPQPAVNNDEIRYLVTGVYEYALSRPHRKGDQIKLLMNPMFEGACYYPTKRDARGKLSYDVEALECLFNGKQLDNPPAEPPTNSESSGSDEPQQTSL